MYRSKNAFLLFLTVLCVNVGLKAQLTSIVDFLYKPTTFQLGWHALDDDASAFKDFTSVSKWSMVYYPARFTVTKTIVSDLKIEFALGYTKMRQSSYHEERYLAPGNFFSGDVNVRYNFPISFPFLERLDQPKASAFNKAVSKFAMNLYPVSGFGFTKRSQTRFANAATFNLGFGGTFWFVKNSFGLTAQSMAKWGLQKPFLRAGSNYIHHSVGVVYVSKGNPARRRSSGNRFKVAKRRPGQRGRSRNRF
jgi:hypothetical protein